MADLKNNKALKELDIKNRRKGEGKFAKCLRDITCASYVQIGRIQRPFLVKHILDSMEIGIYDAGFQCGTLHLAPKGYFLIKRNYHGIDFTAKIKYSDVLCFGDKSPYSF
jgi:hypothetical protein